MGQRLHFLDWLRLILVCCVVYAHVTFCGLPDSLYFDWGVKLDNHGLEKYAGVMRWKEVPHLGTYPVGALRTRWNSICRQWVIPLLFWISGAACSLTFKGHCPKFGRTCGKLLAFTLVGCIANGSMWLLGPRDERCSMDSLLNHPEYNCKGKGILFDFTEDPWTGDVEPYFNQMWYTVALILLEAVNWPLLRIISDQLKSFQIVSQWLFMLIFYGLMTWAMGTECEQPAMLMIYLLVAEALFLAAAIHAVPSRCPGALPVRAMHYICGAVAIAQLGLSPFAVSFRNMSTGYMFYLAVGCNKWFQLGAIMTRARRGGMLFGEEDGVKPLMSRAWPLVIILAVFCAPCTNWYYDGIITYPYNPARLDRSLYAAGTIMMFFIIDRTSRTTTCAAVPGLLAWAGLVLFLFQIVFITVLMALGMRSPEHITWVSIVLAIGFTGIGMTVWRLVFRTSAGCEFGSHYEEQCAELAEPSLETDA